MAVVEDPQGVVFAILTPTNMPTPTYPVAIGDFSWHELATTDPDAAFDFYNRLFGWQKTGDHDMGPMGLYQMFGLNGVSFGGMFRKPADMPAPSHWLVYAKVNDSARMAATAKRAGGTVINGPMEVPGGDWIAQIVDPQGAVFAVHSVKVEPAAGATAKKAAARKAATAKAAAKRPAAAKGVAKKAAAKKSAKTKVVRAKTVKAKAVKKPLRKTTRQATRKAAKRRAVKAVRKAAKRPSARRK
jgi:predicted enzyme related to lactoylglutathione lyase